VIILQLELQNLKQRGTIILFEFLITIEPFEYFNFEEELINKIFYG
jgi:hypothetical protein